MADDRATMEPQMLWPVLAALAGAAVATLWCRWRARQSIAVLQARLQRSEQARQAELVRAQQTRQQIAKLTHMIGELQKRQRETLEQQQARARLEAQVPSDGGPRAAAALPAHGFADTMPM